MADRPYFQEAARTRKTAISNGFLGAEGILCSVILVPILTDTGDVKAYLGGIFYLSRLSQLVEKEKIKPFDAGFLVDRQENLIAHTDQAMLQAGRRERFIKQHPLLTDYFASKGSAGSAKQEEVFFGECLSPVDNKPYFATIVPLSMGWSLVLMRDRASVMAEISPVIWGITSLVGLLLALIGGLGVVIAHGIGQRWDNAERALRSSEERFRLANLATFNAIWDWDLQTNALWWNENFSKNFGYRRDEIEPGIESWTSRIHFEDLGRVETGIHAAIDGGQQYWSDQYRLRRKDGMYAEVEDRGYIAREAGNNPVRMIGAIQDITERKQADEALRVSEERFRRAVVEAPFPILIHAEDGEILTVSRTWEDITGYTHADIPTIADWTEKAYGPRQQLVREDIEKLYDLANRKAEGEYRITCRDGSQRVWDFSSISLGRLLDGRRTAMSMAADVTERKQYVEALAIQKRIDDIFLTIPDEEMYNEVLNVILDVMQSPFGVFGYIDEDGANVVPSMTRHIWDKCQVPDKTFIFPRDTWGCSSWPRAIREKKVNYTNEISTLTPGGHIPVQRHISMPILFQDEVIGLLQVANKKTDYTEADISTLEAIAGNIAPILSSRLKREQAENKILRLNAELEQRVLDRTAQLEAANKELEAFSYSVSHDLRAPLRAIEGFSRIITDDYTDKLDAEGNRLLNVIRSNTSKMDQLITDLLVLSRVSSNELLHARIDMTTLAHSIYHEIASTEILNKFTFSVLSLPDAQGDTALLRQIWINLIANAIKFSAPKEKPVIEISAKVEQGMNIYYVKDNGVGFNPEYTHKLFGVFQRLHKAPEFEGTGIGLAIVQRIIHRHNGTVGAEGRVNEGATFWFAVPVKAVESGV